MSDRPEIMAGVPTTNAWLYRRAPFAAGDPEALIRLPGEGSFLIIRDIEMQRAKEANVADHVHCPADFAPETGLSGDRETATAQAAAEFLRRKNVEEVWTDRSLPMIFADAITKAGIAVHCDREMDVLARRSKTEQEVERLRRAQRLTEQAVEAACRSVARAEAKADGALHAGGEPLTSERLQSEINIWLLRHGMDTSTNIVAPGPQGAEPHNRGSGPLRTGETVIIDVFPMDPASRYYGDCTRTVVHGDIPPEIENMHVAVVEAKLRAINACRVGATGERVHEVTCGALLEKGYAVGLPPENAPDDYTAIVHGTGHGVGLDVHEPPLLDQGGPPLVAGDCVTVEPGLYCRSLGGIRIEDMIIVRDGEPENLNSIPEGLNWA